MNIPGLAFFVGGCGCGLAAAAWVYGFWCDWRHQREQAGAHRAWLNDGADWLHDSQVDQELEQR